MVAENKTLLEYFAEAIGIFRARNSRGNPSFPTGLDFLDEATDGLSKGEVWIISGKSGGGKTSLAMQMFRSFGNDPKHTSLFLSLEMKGWELVARMFCEMESISYTDLKKGIFPADFKEKEEKFKKYVALRDYEIFEYGYKFEEIEKILQTAYEKRKPDVIFIDFIQLIEWRAFGDERLALMEYIRKLKELAKKLNIGIVVVSQLRRLPSGADYNREPDITDLKGSGSLEQTADKVILVYKREERDTITGNTTTRYFINLAKNRQGETVAKEVSFVGQYYKFKEMPHGGNETDTHQVYHSQYND
jgi:replicative DNA helicase